MTNRQPPKTPELDKLESLDTEIRAILRFMDFLGEKELTVCEVDPGTNFDTYEPCYTPKLKLVYEHFGLDAEKIETERRELLADMRIRHGGDPKEVRAELLLEPEPNG